MKDNQLTVVPGSILDRASQSDSSVAEVFARCEIIVVLDQSGSMSAEDTRDGRSRYDVADEELAKIQAAYPGKAALISFDSSPEFCPGGMGNRHGGGTNIVAALEYVIVADGLATIVLVSDGEPNEPHWNAEDKTLEVAGRFKHPIHTIYIGAPGERGEEFLDELARRTGGQRFVSAKPGELGAGVIALLTGG